jgi:hypothetical protein
VPRIRDRERRLARRVHGIPDGASAARSHDAAADVPVCPTRTTTTTAGAIPPGGGDGRIVIVVQQQQQQAAACNITSCRIGYGRRDDVTRHGPNAHEAVG